ncbi:hypothetical protein [Algirhabdus cladophorae]|uniref:hypothetical protein n=1 Tax=Algirhabdus cladophorae TaxID=3377108 RepID=UPI003B845EEF
MTNVTKFPTSSQRFIMTLQIDLDNVVHVRSAEILGAEFRNRVTFNTKTRIEEVLDHGLAAELSQSVRRLEKSKEVLSLPDFQYDTQGISLAGIHLISSALSDGSRQIICRFKHFMGNLFSIVRSEIGFIPQCVDYRDKLASEALTDIAMPLFNLAKALETDVMTADGSKMAHRELTRLHDLSTELAFYSEMLKRFIDNSLRPSSLPAPDNITDIMLPKGFEKLTAIGE